MELKQLRTLLAVAETGSVTRAAQLLHVVQSAVTKQVRTLESELGVDLFQRTRQGMITTDAGQILIASARRVISDLERTETDVRQQKDAVQGTVRIGILDSVTDLVAEPLVARLSRTHPQIDLQITTAFAGHLREWLYEGLLDASILFGVSDPGAVRVTPIATEKLWAMAPRDVGLSDVKPITVRDVAAHPLIVPARGHALRTLIDEATARAHVEPRISVQVNASRLAMRLVAGGHGWTILPAVCFTYGDVAATLSMAPLDDPQAVRDLILASPRSHRPAPATQVVTNALLGLLREAAQDGSWPSVNWRADAPATGHSPVRRGN